MLECLIVGDSIAVGTKMFMKQCADYAKGGINSSQWNKTYKNRELTAKTVIISLGSNDHKYVNTYDELFELRQRVDADRVFWILPHGNLKAPQNLPIADIQKIVQELSDYYGDVVLPINSVQPDGIHPSWAGYKELADKTK
jgi:lysophospholipase L1-like esterase